MLKKILIILLFILPIVYGTVVVEISPDNATWENVSGVETENGYVIVDGLEEGNTYYFRARNDTSDFYYLNDITITSGEKGMSSISVTGFILLITITLFVLPSIVKRFSVNDVLDYSIKGVCYLLGLFLLGLDTAMIATISETFNLGLTNEIFRFLWLINWTTYLAMLYVVIIYGWKVLQLWNVDREQKRMGLSDEETE